MRPKTKIGNACVTVCVVWVCVLCVLGYLRAALAVREKPDNKQSIIHTILWILVLENALTAKAAIARSKYVWYKMCCIDARLPSDRQGGP